MESFCWGCEGVGFSTSFTNTPVGWGFSGHLVISILLLGLLPANIAGFVREPGTLLPFCGCWSDGDGDAVVAGAGAVLFCGGAVLAVCG